MGEVQWYHDELMIYFLYNNVRSSPPQEFSTFPMLEYIVHNNSWRGDEMFLQI